MRRLTGLLCGMILAAEGASAGPQWAFRIHFTDKTGSPALSAPAAFLSARALQRRSQQGIAVVDEDRPVSATYIADVLSAAGGKLHTTSRWFNQCVVLLDDSSRVAQLQGKTYISGIDYLGYFATALHRGTPVNTGGTAASSSTPPARRGTGTAAYYGNTWGQTAMVNGDYLHDQGYRGEGQLIAVLDYDFHGVNTHPGFDSLRSSGRLLDAWNFVNASADIYTPYWDGHGTSSLSAMAGLVPGTYVGSAPHAQYALYLTDDNNISDAMYETDNFVAGLERADSLGADVVTSSLGYNYFVHPPPYYIYPKSMLDGHTTLFARAENRAVAKGMFVVSSAGNEGTNPDWNFLLSPGDADSAECVGAVGSNRAIAGFSSPGPNSSGRIKPDVVLQGSPAAVFSATGYTSLSGTSFSTPQLAGWAACLRQSKPTASPYLMRTAINGSADRAAAPTPKEGYGIPDFKKALGTLDVHTVQLPGDALVVSPNPFSGTVQLQLTVQQPVAVTCILTDAQGREVARRALSATAAKSQYELAFPAALPAGTYFLQTIIGSQTFTSKLIRR